MRKLVKLFLTVLIFAIAARESEAFAFSEKGGGERKEGLYTKTKKTGLNKSDNPDIQRERSRAASSVSEVDAMQRYVDYLSPSDLNRLPIGLKKKIGNSTVKIAVSNAVFTPKYAELTIYAKIDIPQNNNGNAGNNGSNTKTIFFGIKGLKLSKDGGIIGSSRLVLLGDYKIPINGNNSSLTLKGSFDTLTGAINEKTYIEIDCNGFKELGISADVEFPRSMIVPVDISGNETAGLVKASFSTIVSNWNDIMATVTLPKFQVKGVKGVSFDIQNAVIDLSDLRNSADIIYPVGYKEKYLDKNPDLANLWRGVYAKEIRITLPKSFDDKTTNDPVSFGTRDLIIDNNGITGLFYAENILPLDKGSAGGWKFSVDSFRIALEANRLLRAGFGGKIGLPVNDDKFSAGQSSIDSNLIKQKFLAYSAIISTSGDYLCRVVTKDSLSFDVWKANVLLKPNSYIELAGNSERFLPSAMLHGSMNISSKTGTSGNERLTKILDFKGVEFQALHIQTVTPYLTAQYFGYNGSIKLGILPVSIDSIALKSFSSNELGIGFNLKINLQDSSFSGKTRLYVIGMYNQEEGLSKWKYNRLKVEDISINAKIGIMSLNGTITFLDDDPKYGDGFRGNISLKFEKPDSLGVTATALFGNKGFRYWFVDGLAEFPSIGSGVFNINGFGGGAYYRMKKNGFDPTLSPTGLEYVPDSTSGLGIRASVLFNVGSQKLDHGQATFEVGFNRHGGMRYMGFYGFAKIMAPLNVSSLPGGSTFAFLKTQFKNVEDEMKTWSILKIDSNISKKIFQPTAAAEDLYKGKLDASFDVDFRAILGINYDFNQKTFHANFDLYATTPGNIITGIGPGGRAGWAVMHIDPTKWYLHMGTPTDPIGLKIALGPISVQTSAYFMMGHDLPAFPELPTALRNLISGVPATNINAFEKDEIRAGRGIAFGAGVQVATGDIKFLILYAKFQAGMGFDVMVKDFSNYTCTNTNKVPGINGWYAQGQVYAYLQGECGVRIKIGPIRKNIPIIKGAAVALLQARLPNPSWFGGLFLIDVRLLGGKIKIKVNLKFAFGDECVLQASQNPVDQIDFDEFKVVQSVTPSNSAQNISLFARPVVTCMTTPEASFALPPDENGGAEETYRPHISSMLFTNGTRSFGCKYKLSTDSTKLTLYPDSNFIAQTNYTLTIKIVYQKLVSGNWANVTNADGTPFLETTVTSFKTGDNPPNIPDDNIGYMYPYKNQRFFYKNEVTSGRVLLTSSRDDLFSSFTTWKAKFIHATTKQVVATTNVTYNSTARSVTYPIPSELQLNNPYILEIFGEGFNVGSLITDTTRPILQLSFNTSKYNTLSEKISALQAVLPTPVVGRIESDVIDLQAKVAEYEGFDLAELTASELTGNRPLIRAEAILGDNYYYNYKIQPLIHYPYFYSSQGVTILRDTSAGYEIIPVNAVEVPSYYLNAAMSPNYSSILYDRLPFAYGLNRIFNADYIDLRNRIVNKYMATLTGAPTNVPMYEWYRPCWLCSKRQRLTQAWVDYFNSSAYKQALSSGSIASIPVEMRDIVTKPFPFMTKGDYKVNFKIRKAVSWSGIDNFNYEESAPAIFTYYNPIESIFTNELKYGTFTKNNCSTGETGGSVTYYIQPGTYSSTVSQQDADQLAINALNQYGQNYANQNGNCCVNGNCYVPGIVPITLLGYTECYGSAFAVTFQGPNGSYYYEFPSGWYGASTDIYIAAGTYEMTFTSSSPSGTTFTLENTWQNWYGNYIYSGQVVFSSDTQYRLSVSSSCGYY